MIWVLAVMPKVTVSFAAGASLFITTVFAQSALPIPVRITLTQLPGIGHADVIAEFRVSEGGGSISYTPARAGDSAAGEAVSKYGMLLRRQFASGDLSALSTFAPAAAEAAARIKGNAGVLISIQRTPKSVVVNFAASDQNSRTAIHDYIRIARGRPELTAEERTLNHPGNNLGWDAPKSGDLQK